MMFPSHISLNQKALCNIVNNNFLLDFFVAVQNGKITVIKSKKSVTVVIDD